MSSPGIASPLWTTVSGTLRVYFVPCEPIDGEHAAELQAVVERFIAALRLGLLPGTLEAVHGVALGDDGKVDARVEVKELELGALRVLYGMAIHFMVNVAPLGTIMAWCEPVGSTPNLFDIDAPSPAHHGPLPFDASFALRGAGVASPLVVEVVFGRELDVWERERFDREIRVWVALLHGGYPEHGELPGTSEVGPFVIGYDEPKALRFTVEGSLAGVECFEPLKALVVRWSASVPVVRLVVA